jgi:dTDP-glucose 4,6-dehydratase
MKYLITGGCGFIGANYIDMLLDENGNIDITNIDKHTSISNNFLSMKYSNDPRYHEIVLDLSTDNFDHIEVPDIIINFAAETHVDRSCESAHPFIASNVIATTMMIEYAIQHDVPIIHISTDEVYGALELNEEPFTEHYPISPSNPYSATKASGEFMVKSIANANNFDKYIITRCSNNYGCLQDSTKLIPVCVKHLVNGSKIPIYGEGKQIRDWIHVLDNCTAINMLANKLLNGECCGWSVNIGANNEWTNIDIANKICYIMNISSDDGITFIEDPRGNAHDLRYAIDSTKLRGLGWTPKVTHPFDFSFEKTIEWYIKKYFKQ